MFSGTLEVTLSLLRSYFLFVRMRNHEETRHMHHINTLLKLGDGLFCLFINALVIWFRYLDIYNMHLQCTV